MNSEANLSECDLWEAGLSGAILWEANLQDAKLEHVDFGGKEAQKSRIQSRLGLRGGRDKDRKDLGPAVLEQTNLRNSVLSNAKLSDVTGLLTGDLAGANLSNAKLPEILKSLMALRTSLKPRRTPQLYF